MRGMRTIGIGLAFALLIGATAAHAGWDDRSATDSFFIEGGGPGLLYSVNYEHIFENDFGFRGGFSYTSLSATAGSSSASASFIAVPIVLSYLGASSGNHALELGGGATLINASGAASGTGVAVSGSGMTVLGTAQLGYRRQPVEGGFMFRIGVEALFGKGLAFKNPDPNAFGVLPWAYLSLGFTL